MTAVGTRRPLVVVGAAHAGVSLVRELRRRGDDRPITMLGAEGHQPYDRPPLSKSALAERSGEDLRPTPLLGTEEDLDEDLGVDVRTGARVTGVDTLDRTVECADGSRVPADEVVLAVGARAARPGWREPRAGVHVLRTIDDAYELRSDLDVGTRLVVVGDGLIATEVAQAVAPHGVDVTLVGLNAAPLADVLPAAVLPAYSRRLVAHGIRHLGGDPVVAINGRWRVSGIRLRSGRTVPADVVLVAVGATDDLDWVRSCGITVDAGVVCDRSGRTSVPGVWALGDCARWWNPLVGTYQRHLHWTHAVRQAEAMATAMTRADGDVLPHPTDSVFARPAYVWSVQGDAMLQISGDLRGGELTSTDGADLAAVDGWTGERGGVMVAHRNDRVVGVLGFADPRRFGRRRRECEVLPEAAAERLAL